CAAANSACSPAGCTRQIDWLTPSTSPAHCSAYCVQSTTSARLTNPSSNRTRAASCSCSSSLASSTATRTRGTPVYGVADPLRFVACRRAPTPTSAAGSGGARRELSSEGGVFSNDFLIPLAFDRRLADRSDLADRF